MTQKHCFLQGVLFDKVVELDHQEVMLRKAHAIETKPALRAMLEKKNPAQIMSSSGRVMSQQYCALPADLRNVDQVCSCFKKETVGLHDACDLAAADVVQLCLAGQRRRMLCANLRPLSTSSCHLHTSWHAINSHGRGA